jgi:hypothetical protein
MQIHVIKGKMSCESDLAPQVCLTKVGDSLYNKNYSIEKIVCTFSPLIRGEATPLSTKFNFEAAIKTQADTNIDRVDLFDPTLPEENVSFAGGSSEEMLLYASLSPDFKNTYTNTQPDGSDLYQVNFFPTRFESPTLKNSLKIMSNSENLYLKLLPHYDLAHASMGGGGTIEFVYVIEIYYHPKEN